MKRIQFALGKGTPMVQSPILGIWCCAGDLLDAKRIRVAQALKRGSPTVARRDASYESIRSVRANGNCDEDDRWKWTEA